MTLLINLKLALLFKLLKKIKFVVAVDMIVNVDVVAIDILVVKVLDADFKTLTGYAVETLSHDRKHIDNTVSIDVAGRVPHNDVPHTNFA